MEFKIVNMQPGHIEQIMEIESVSFGGYYWSESSFMAEIKNEYGNYFVAEDLNKNVLGYAGFWLVMDEAHITTIAVQPKLRKNKLGEVLLQRMIVDGYEKGAKWFTLEVRASNIPAQNLYYKYGFKSLGLRRKYYQDNDEDALIMWTENIWHNEFKERYKKRQRELKKFLDQSKVLQLKI